MKRKLLLLSILTFLSLSINSQTAVPDDAFETYLETHDATGLVVSEGDASSLGDGTDGNNLVTTTKINGITDLTLQYLGIEKLDGLEDFAALENLTFYENNSNQTTVDLTANTNLINIVINGSVSLTTLNVAGLANVTKLYFVSSGVANLDVSSLVALTELQLGNHSLLTSLNIKNGFNTNITVASFNQNPLLNCITADAGIPALGLPNWSNNLNIVFDESCS
ncbi:MAG: hypothetical protein V3V28_05695 [Polaribacter sp.]|uniref:hypothetical protein n=1 Tax=Polaribacter sp. TaxID=1920175 RepID=UPI002F352AB0